MFEEKNHEIREVLNKYLEKEKELEVKICECGNLLNNRAGQNDGVEQDIETIIHSRYDRGTSMARNQQLLKDLEKSKAILRTESTFSPNERELSDLATVYRKFLQE